MKDCWRLIGFLHYWLSTNCHGRPYKEDITLCILVTLHLTKTDVNQMSMNHMCLLEKANKYKNIVGKYKISVTLQPCSYPNHWSLVLLPTTGGFQGESTSCFLRLSSRFIMSITSDSDFLWAVLLRSWSSPDYNIGNANTSRSGAKIIKDTHHFSIFAEHQFLLSLSFGQSI